MKTSTVHIKDFKRDQGFYGRLDLVLTVKSFELQAIRQRYIASRANKSGKAGSVERREPSIGGLVTLSISEGRINHESVICRVKEPRGIDHNNDHLALATENLVHIITGDGKKHTLEDPWFSYIHTLDFHPVKPNHILISSSGFDLILEYDFANKEKTFEWLAWEHGFNQGHNPETGLSFTLTRDPDLAKKLEMEGAPFELIRNPETDHLPTAKRAAFINGVSYHPEQPDQLIATFFHEGAVYQIDAISGRAQLLLDMLKNPHGGHFNHQLLVATSTGTGEIVTLDQQKLTRYRLADLPGKPEALGELEWVQNTITFGNLFIAIDSNRNSFVIFDPIQRLYDMIPYDIDWAVQDLIPAKLSAGQTDQLSSITSAN